MKYPTPYRIATLAAARGAPMTATAARAVDVITKNLTRTTARPANDAANNDNSPASKTSAVSYAAQVEIGF